MVERLVPRGGGSGGRAENSRLDGRDRHQIPRIFSPAGDAKEFAAYVHTPLAFSHCKHAPLRIVVVNTLQSQLGPGALCSQINVWCRGGTSKRGAGM
eukprot:1195273-Prorocentrum_minimum.AAC.6